MSDHRKNGVALADTPVPENLLAEKILADKHKHPAGKNGHVLEAPVSPEAVTPLPRVLSKDIAEMAEAEPTYNPSTLATPAFMLCPPFSLSSAEPNNIWMEEYTEEARKINKKKAMQQFLALYQFLSAEALVYLLPAPAECRLQDASYAANVAFIPEHLPEKNLALIANFTSPPRMGESKIAARFLKALGYNAVHVPYRFEGEAELKHLHDNIYIGGYGARSERKAYEWMEQQFDMKVIPVEERVPYLYHLDCSVFPLDRENTMVCTELFNQNEVAAIAKHTNIVPVTQDECFNGICNSLRLHNMLLNASDINDHKAGTENYDFEIKKNRKLEDIAARFCLELVFFNLSEYLKSGALLSCLVMHLNRFSYGVQLY